LKPVSPQDLQSLTEKMLEVTTKQCQIISDDPKRAFKSFFKFFVKIKAAGGLVLRDEQMLFIRRNKKWDLPKGKVEKKESIKTAAVREVIEECGLLNAPKIRNKITKTFHVYQLKDKSYKTLVGVVLQVSYFVIRHWPYPCLHKLLAFSNPRLMQSGSSNSTLYL